MCLAALQSERQVQLLAKVLNDEIDLIVSHVCFSCYHFATQLVLLSQSVAAFAEKNHIFEKTHLFSMRRG